MARYVRKPTKPLTCLFVLFALVILQIQLLSSRLVNNNNNSKSLLRVIAQISSKTTSNHSVHRSKLLQLAPVRLQTEMTRPHPLRNIHLWHPGMIRDLNETFTSETLRFCHIEANRRLRQNRGINFKQIQDGNIYVPHRDYIVARTRYTEDSVDPKYDLPNLTHADMKAIAQRVRHRLSEHAQMFPSTLVNYSRDDLPEIFKYFEPEVFRIIPPKDQLISDKKNPCFNTNETKGRTSCLPYAYLGGAPKCATTDVWNRLRAHPEVISREKAKKEPHFWTRGQHKEDHVLHYLGILSIKPGGKQDRDWWNRYKIGVDASACTLWDNARVAQYLGNPPEGPPIILADILRAVQPYAKFVFILRNPTHRLYSDYLYLDYIWKISGVESAKDFHDRVQNIIRVFNLCLLDNSFRHCASRSYAPVRIDIGMYSVHLREWLHRYPRNQILILRTETWEKNLKQEYKKICDFLELSELSEEKMDEIMKLENSRVRPRQDDDLGPMLKETKELLDQFYEPFNKDLAKLLNDDDYLWSDSQNRL
ncbi:Carbohydrate sulfotransferase 15 [Holothuria leucospilota]|uniref:Carbohydrate sulfotransferase 15 n=1 Tax=Holothuria leucospilota TaxID=206669 RepID=A0A9Q0YIS2_HOLLE|nr:Carbohydrate sulfotransferase 15 [Holothuria leucospilota]